MHYGLAPSQFVIEQGVDMGRPSYIEAEVKSIDGLVTQVRIGGSAVLVLQGELIL